jgi:hypothetical protein
MAISYRLTNINLLKLSKIVVALRATVWMMCSLQAICPSNRDKGEGHITPSLICLVCSRRKTGPTEHADPSCFAGVTGLPCD